MPRAGHPGSGPEIRDLMSRTMQIWCSRSRMSGLGPGCPARRFQIGIWTSKLDLGRKWMISGAKFDGFRGWKVGKLAGKLDPLKAKQIHGSNPTKFHHTNKSQKIGAIFVGNFRIRDKINKNKARNTTRRLRNRDQRGS